MEGEKIDTEKLLEKIESLATAGEWETSENLLSDILLPLFENEGYDSIEKAAMGKPSPTRTVVEWDLVIARSGDELFHQDSIGVEVKTYKEQRVDADVVERTIHRARVYGLKRTLIFSRSGFSAEATAIATRYKPQQVELHDIQSLRAWASGLAKTSDEHVKCEIELIVKFASKAFIEAVAKNPRALDALEWRDLERMLAEAFEGVGFSVTLTPPSKDGGKDLILRYEVQGTLKSYIVEVKHWRAGNKVGKAEVESFLGIIVNEKHDGGVFISTYGYTGNAFESLTKVQRKTLKFGAESKVVSLCKTYLRVNNGLWSPELNMTDTLLEYTV